MHVRSCAALACAVALVAVSVASGTSSAAHLRLLHMKPLSVAGSGFAPKSAIVVRETFGSKTTRATAHSDRRGLWRISFPGSINGCGRLRIVATDGRNNEAHLAFALSCGPIEP